MMLILSLLMYFTIAEQQLPFPIQTTSGSVRGVLRMEGVFF